MRRAIVQIPTHNLVLTALTLYTLVRLNDNAYSGLVIGLVVSAQAAGALFGSLGAASLVQRLGPGRAFLATGWSWVVLVPIICLLSSPLWLAIAFACLWVLAPSQRVGVASYQALRMPDDHLGKVRSSSGVIVQLASMAGPLIGVAIVGLSEIKAAAALFVLTLMPVLASTASRGVRLASLDREEDAL